LIQWGVLGQNKYQLLTQYRPSMPFGNRKKKLKKLEGLFSSVLSQFKKYHPAGNLKFVDLGIFQSLKFRILMGGKSSNFS